MTVFVFKLQPFFTKKVKFIQMFIKSALYLTKRPITGKQKQLSSTANGLLFYFFILDIIMVTCNLQSLNLIRGSIFSKNKELSKNRISPKT